MFITGTRDLQRRLKAGLADQNMRSYTQADYLSFSEGCWTRAIPTITAEVTQSSIIKKQQLKPEIDSSPRKCHC